MKTLKNILTAALFSGLVALTGCGGDSPSNDPGISNTNSTSSSSSSDQSQTGDFDVVYSSRGGHISTGQSVNYDLEVSPNSKYRLTMNYSNDDNAQIDDIVIRANGSEVGRLNPPADTGDWGGGWFNPVDSPDYTVNTDGSGRLFVDVFAQNTDSYGFRVQSIVLKKLE